MKTNSKFFKNSRSLPVDKFFHNVLYDKKIGYYNSKLPFGGRRLCYSSWCIDLFSEMMPLDSFTWEIYGKPKNFNIVELGPGDGSLMRTLLQVLKILNSTKQKIYLFEISNLMKKLQKKY